MTDNHAVTQATDCVAERIKMPPKPDRATCEAARRSQLDRIRHLDIKHSQLMANLGPYVHHHNHNQEYRIKTTIYNKLLEMVDHRRQKERPRTTWCWRISRTRSSRTLSQVLNGITLPPGKEGGV
jgi:hypothetical protein